MVCAILGKFPNRHKVTRYRSCFSLNYLLYVCFGTLRATFISVLSLAIQNLSLPLPRFQRSYALRHWKDIFNEKVLLRLSSANKFSQNLKRYEDGSNSTTPFDIYLPYIHKAPRYCQNWCGLLLFYPYQGNARSQLAR